MHRDSRDAKVAYVYGFGVVPNTCVINRFLWSQTFPYLDASVKITESSL